MGDPKSKIAGEDRRERILAAITPLVADHGLDGVTTKAMAAAAGVSEALLYKHFPSKDELFAAIEELCIQHATADVAQFEKLPDSTECLVMIVWLMMNNICMGSKREEMMIGEKRPLIRMMMRSLLEDGDFASNFLEGAAEGWVRKVRACAVAARKAGELVESATHGTLGVWFGHHLSIAMVMMSLPGTDTVDYGIATEDGVAPSQEALVEHSVRFVLRGMGLTPEALERYYKPDNFIFLLAAGRG